MGSVFAQACTVVVYLGDWEDPFVVFRLIDDIGDDAFPTLHSLGKELSPQTRDAYLERFFSFPWWSRVWTVQEYALARTVIFQSGKHVLHGISLEKGLRIIFGRPSCDTSYDSPSQSVEVGGTSTNMKTSIDSLDPHP
jgi:hypothetical protein